MKRTLFFLLISLVLFVGCQRNEFQGLDSSLGQRFALSLNPYQDSLPQSKATTTALTDLVVGVYNAKGDLVRNVHTSMAADWTSITLEGLADGSYTAVFMGVGQVADAVKPVLTPPAKLTDTWTPPAKVNEPLGNEYFYAKSQFTITQGVGNPSSVALSRLVGRVEIAPILDGSQFNGHSITDLRVTFDDGAVYAFCGADGVCGGAGNIKSYQVARTLGFFSLPTIDGARKRGVVEITGVMGDGSLASDSYSFEVYIKSNQRTVIRPSYAPGQNDQFGFIRVYDLDRTALTSKTFFNDGDSYKEVASRSFKASQLLTVKFIDSGRKMVSSFYSLLPVKNVTLLAKRKSDTHFFELAWFESLLAFEDRYVDLSSTMLNKVFKSETGELVVIDQLTNDMEYKYRSDDPHMQKLMKITWPCRVNFQTPDGDTLLNKKRNRACRAVHAREAVSMFTNTGFVYCADNIFIDKMYAMEKESPLKDKGRVVDMKTEYFPRMMNKSRDNYVILGIMVSGWDWGLSNIGDGNAYWLHEYACTGHYLSQNDALFRVTCPHEYGHVLGYSHDGDLTQTGCRYEQAVKQTQWEFQQQLPYYSSSLLNSASNPNRYNH
ncbi:MAG: hypothetical protein RRY42_03945 [Mucinivorans sp.]